MCFYPITVFPVIEAPRWQKGYIVDICFVAMTWIVFSIGVVLKMRDDKKRKRLELQRVNLESREISQIRSLGRGMKYL